MEKEHLLPESFHMLYALNDAYLRCIRGIFNDRREQFFAKPWDDTHIFRRAHHGICLASICLTIRKNTNIEPFESMDQHRVPNFMVQVRLRSIRRIYVKGR